MYELLDRFWFWRHSKHGTVKENLNTPPWDIWARGWFCKHCGKIR